MTLKEKFQQEPVVVYQESFKLTNQSAELLEEIAEEFAIGFAEWRLTTFIKHVDEYTTKELLELYKKQKGL